MKAKERPIIFNAEMVKAILDGHKTMTRRVIKPQPFLGDKFQNYEPQTGICHYGQVGDSLWVRETWMHRPIPDISQPRSPKSILYKATNPEVGEAFKWRPSIFMPRWASRILLEITEIGAERLRDTTEEDAIAEGIEQILCEPDDATNKALRGIGAEEVTKAYPIGWKNYQYKTDKRYIYDPNPEPEVLRPPKDSFRTLWDSLNAKRGYSWESNPWVWVISFKKD